MLSDANDYLKYFHTGAVLIISVREKPEDACTSVNTISRKRTVRICLNKLIVVLGDNSCSRGCRFESRRPILDGLTFFHIDLL